MKQLFGISVLVLLVALMGVMPAQAAKYLYWNSAVDDSVDVAGNWTCTWDTALTPPCPCGGSAVPGDGDLAIIKEPGVVKIDSTHLFAGAPSDIWVGDGTGITMVDPCENSAWPYSPNDPGAGHVRQTNGDVSYQYWFLVGRAAAPGASSYDLEGGSLSQTMNTGGEFHIGQYSTGTMTISNPESVGTSLTVQSSAFIGYAGGSVGTLEIKDDATAWFKQIFRFNSDTGMYQYYDCYMAVAIWPNSVGHLKLADTADMTVDGTVAIGDNWDSAGTATGDLTMTDEATLDLHGLRAGNSASADGTVTLSNKAELTVTGYSAFGPGGGTARLTMNQESKYFGNYGHMGGTSGGHVNVVLNDDAQIQFVNWFNVGEAGCSPIPGLPTLQMNGNSSVSAGSVDVAYATSSTATAELNGTSSITTAGPLSVAVWGDSPNSGTVDVQTTSTDPAHTALKVGTNAAIGFAGNGNVGTVNLKNTADMTVGTILEMGYYHGTGYVNVAGSATLTVANDTTRVGLYGGTGYLTVSNSAQATMDDCQVGVNWGDDEYDIGIGTVTVEDNAVVNVTGVGTHTDNETNVFDNTIAIGAVGGDGTWNQNGGTTTCANTVMVGEYDWYVWEGAWSPGHGVLNLNGGVFECPGISMRSNSAVVAGTTGDVNFNGGTLRATASNPDFVGDDGGGGMMTLIVHSGGAVIDSNTFHIGITLPMVDGGGGGGLTKLGGGRLTLGGPCTYTGDTLVNVGELAVTGSITSDVSVADGATLLGDGTINGDVVVAGGGGSGGSIAPGLSMGTLTVTGDVEVDGTLDVEYNTDTGECDLLVVSGELDLTEGTLSFTDLGSATLGNAPYVIATYGTLTGEAANEDGVPDDWYVDYAFGGGNVIALVPEPAMLALLAGLLLALAGCRIRR